jgi:site-specific DNA-methyltransferase (adenine-specific)
MLNRFYNMDCMDGMAMFPDKYFELAIVDPPYGIGNWIQVTGEVNPNHSAVTWNEKSNRPGIEYFNELRRVSKNRIIWGANYYPDAFERENGAIVWDKGIARETHYSVCEIASQSFNKRVDCVRIRWLAAVDKKPDDMIHPCSKPVALYKWLLHNYAKPGDKILDTHVGSASSLIACHEKGFRYVGFELDPDYYAAAKARLDKAKAQVSIFDAPEVRTEQLDMLDMIGGDSNS